MVRTITAIELHPSKYKTLRLQLIVDMQDEKIPTPKLLEDEASDLAELLVDAVCPHFAQAFLEKFRALNQSKLSV
jgi:hypothetical protein